MQISKFSVNNQAFGAKTTIKDDNNMLSKKDRADLIRIGSNIGTDKDTIEITLGDLQPNQIVRDVEGYDYVINSEFRTPSMWVKKSEELTVPFYVKGEFLQMNTPKNFLVRTLEKIAASIR